MGDGGAVYDLNGMTLLAHGGFAVVADVDAGLLAPDLGPLGAEGNGADEGTFFGEGL
jgi:hypothetical protein